MIAREAPKPDRIDEQVRSVPLEMLVQIYANPIVAVSL